MVAQSQEALQVEQQILAAADHLIAVHDEWESDEKAPIQPTQAFEEALVNLANACGGDIPSRCRELSVAVARLTEEWNQYAEGQRDRKGCPLPKFWGAFRNFLTCRTGAQVKPVKRPEPVAALIEQKVSYQQIAFHIWGHNGKGPFINAAGQPDIDLIRQAAAGTYKEHENWVHPLEQTRSAADNIASRTRIQNVLRIEQDSDAFTEDKASIEEMIREGQFANVIARVKRVSVDEVYRIANQKGLSVAEKPNLAAERAPHEPPIPESVHRSMPSGNTQQGEDRTPKTIPASPLDAEKLNSEITRMFSEGMGAPEIAKELSVTPQKVAAVLRENKKRQTVAVQTGTDDTDEDDGDDEE